MNRGTTILFCSCFAAASVLLSAHEESKSKAIVRAVSAQERANSHVDRGCWQVRDHNAEGRSGWS